MNTARTAQFAVGLTGGIGSGKTRVANAFAERGAAIIDTDTIARQLTAPGGAAIARIRDQFGAAMISADGAMDRAKMRELIFSDAAQKKLLEAILHPMIREQVALQSGTISAPYLMVVVPLLAESGHWRFPRVLAVDCTAEQQIQRVVQRDGLSEQLVQSIVAQQASRAQRLAIATEVLHNQDTFDSLIPEIDRLHQFYCQLASAN